MGAIVTTNKSKRLEGGAIIESVDFTIRGKKQKKIMDESM